MIPTLLKVEHTALPAVSTILSEDQTAAMTTVEIGTVDMMIDATGDTRIEEDTMIGGTREDTTIVGTTGEAMIEGMIDMIGVIEDQNWMEEMTAIKETSGTEGMTVSKMIEKAMSKKMARRTGSWRPERVEH